MKLTDSSQRIGSVFVYVILQCAELADFMVCTIGLVLKNILDEHESRKVNESGYSFLPGRMARFIRVRLRECHFCVRKKMRLLMVLAHFEHQFATGRELLVGEERLRQGNTVERHLSDILVFLAVIWC